MKRFFYVFGIVLLIVLSIIILLGVFAVNQESTEYQSNYSYSDATLLKNAIANKGKDAIVIITSPSCSGVDHFMPIISKQQSQLKSKEIKIYYVIHMLNTKKSDSILYSIMNKYKINYTPLIINPNKYPSGNLFDLKSKYNKFLTELCGSCNDGSLGYPLYIYYKKGKYLDKSYYLDKQFLLSLNDLEN